MSVISGFLAFKTSLCPKQANNLLLNSFPHPVHFEGRIWTGPDICLGHRKLPTTPQSTTSVQPIWLASHDLVITADARLDNRNELENKLSLQQSRSERLTFSDSFLILKSFLQWGEQCTEHLLGDFVFAIWNNRSKELFAARDHLGIRPFYYHYSSRFFTFCNEMKGLLELPHVKMSLDDCAVADFLTGNYEDCENTIYQSIKRLPPAHSLWLKNTTLNVRRYWRLSKQEPLHLTKDTDYSDALRELIHQAIDCRLRTAFPAGVMLSGGLDSSALTAIATHVCHEHNIPFSTYSYVLPKDYDGDQTDERKFIDILLQKTGNDHNYVMGSQQNPLMFSDKYFEILSEPLRDPFYFIQDSIYGKAKQNNVRVLLTGIGGDMTASFSGRNCLAHLTTKLKLRNIYNLLQLRQSISGEQIPKLIRQQIIAKLLPPSIYSACRLLIKGRSFGLKKQYAISSFLSKKTHLQLRLRNLRQIETMQNSLDHQQQILFAVTSGHLAAFMEHRHATAAAFGISVNHPYFDIRIVKFCMSLPHEQFIKDGWYRSIFRRAIKDIVPTETTYRSDKQPFIPDYAQRIVQNRSLIENILCKNAHVTTRYLDINEISKHLNYLCSTTENIDWHPSTISLLGHGVSLAAFLHWHNARNTDQIF